MPQLEGIYHDEATDEEKAKEKSVMCRGATDTDDSTLSGLTQATSYR